MDKAKILIVEDNSSWASKMEKLLEKAGYRITDKIGTVEGAKASIEKNIPDLVILDIELIDSKHGGIEVAKHIRENRLMIHIIFLSWWNDPNLQKLAAETRFSHYLTKNDIHEKILLSVDMALRVPLAKLYESKIRKANGQVIYPGGNWLWIKGEIVKIAHISFIEARKSRSSFHFLNRDTITVTIYLAKIMKAITHPHLVRVHNSYVVNVCSIKRGGGSSYIFVTDLGGKNKERGIPVSKKYTKELFERWLRFGQKP